MTGYRRIQVGNKLNEYYEGVYDTGEWMEYKCGCQEPPGARPDRASVPRMGELDAGTITIDYFNLRDNLLIALIIFINKYI